jgi:multisubunit Na+/H+ antiporter MnhE subunit
MLYYLILTVTFAIIWMIITAQFNPGGFVVGCVISLMVVLIQRPPIPPLRPARLPRQLAAAVVYALTLFRDIFLSSVDVARRALSPDMRLKPGIIAVPVQDPHGREIVAALAAHNITITPGELVVDFDDESRVMYVHCLDVDQSTPIAEAAEKRRVTRLRDLLGDDL